MYVVISSIYDRIIKKIRTSLEFIIIEKKNAVKIYVYTFLHSRIIFLTSDSSKQSKSADVPCNIPLEPSISFFRAGPEYGSCLSIAEASSSKRDASSTRSNALGMSCFRISSSELLIVSRPT